MMKTFTQQKRERKLTTVAKIKAYLQNKRIKIVNNAGGHNYGINGTTILLETPTMHVSTTGLSGGFPGGNTINFNEFMVIDILTKDDILNNIEDIEKNIKSLKRDIADEKLKLEFLKETKSKEFNENEFKAFKTLSLLENDSLSKIEKARLIATLID